LFLGVLDCKTGLFEYCNAGHNAPILRANGEWRKLDVVANLPLGIEPEFAFQAQRIQWHLGDMLFLYTDGLTEAENAAHAQYGEQRMLEELVRQGEQRKGYSPLELVNALRESVAHFVDCAEQSDDLTMMAIRYQQPALIMRNDIEQIPTLSEWIEWLKLPDALNTPINLALEEAVVNVMNYAYPGRNGQVLVEFEKTDKAVFTITDSGIPFDPTQQAEADTSLSAEERPIGGLGIFLVRQLMDEVRYERIDDKNVLTLIKTV
jgi:sigma-B regulation protein RsbU (phosphoserine phosphatase)